MPAHWARLSTVAAAVLASWTVAAAPGDASLRDACFTPQALAGKTGENLSRRHDKSYDAPPAAEDQPLDQKGVAPEGAPGAVRRVDLPAGKKMIALTFDLCEQPGEIAGYDGAIIDYLRRENVKATFFA